MNILEIDMNMNSMNESGNGKYKRHLFICTNDREDASIKTCGSSQGLLLVQAFKKHLKDLGLSIEIRAQKAGCLDVCASGPALVVYPEAVFYGNVQLTDVAEIIESHLVNGLPVERLRLRFNKVL